MIQMLLQGHKMTADVLQLPKVLTHLLYLVARWLVGGRSQKGKFVSRIFISI